MPGFTATAFVRLLRFQRAAANKYLQQVRAEQDVKAFLVQQAVAALDAIDGVLAEAIKLQNAIIAEEDFVIQRDGTVRLVRAASSAQTSGQQSMEVV